MGDQLGNKEISLEWWEAWRIEPGQNVVTDAEDKSIGPDPEKKPGYNGIDGHKYTADDWWESPWASDAGGNISSFGFVRISGMARFFDCMPEKGFANPAWKPTIFSGGPPMWIYGMSDLGMKRDNPKTLANHLLSHAPSDDPPLGEFFKRMTTNHPMSNQVDRSLTSTWGWGQGATTNVPYFIPTMFGSMSGIMSVPIHNGVVTR